MIVKKLRLRRGWSQEQLAHVTDLSVRTIQRIERGDKPGLETATSLASVFEVDLSTFDTGLPDMSEKSDLESIESEMKHPKVEIAADELEAMRYVKGIKQFYIHLFVYIMFAVAGLIRAGLEEATGVWIFMGWGFAVLIHGLISFEAVNFIGPKWEKAQIEKRIGRKL